MSEMTYQRQLQISAEKVSNALSEVSEVNESEEDVDVDTGDSHPKNVDAVDVEDAEFDLSTEDEDKVEGRGLHIPELDRRSTFFLGTTTHFGRQNHDQIIF